MITSLAIVMMQIGCSGEEEGPPPVSPPEEEPLDSEYYLDFEDLHDGSLYSYEDGNYEGGYNNEVVVNPYSIVPLTAVLKVKTVPADEVDIRVIGQDGADSDVSKTVSKRTWHEIPILGLYGGDDEFVNEVEITVRGRMKTIRVKTESLDLQLPVIGIALEDMSPADSGMHLLEYSFQNPAGFKKRIPLIFDRFGKIRWYHIPKGGIAIKRIETGYFRFPFQDENKLPRLVREISMLGEEKSCVAIPEEFLQIHHDLVENPINGNMWITVHGPGEKWGSTVIEMDREGTLIRSWDVGDIVNEVIGENDIVEVGEDWFHNNSIWYDERDHSLILSGRNQFVVKIDYETGSIVWILGDENKAWYDTPLRDYALEPIEPQDYEPPLGQHNVQLLPKGNLYLFDNGFDGDEERPDLPDGLGRGYSRGVEYELDEENMTVRQVWQYGKQRGINMYSTHISGVSCSPNGDRYIVSGVIRQDPYSQVRVVELLSTLEGERVFEAVLNGALSSGRCEAYRGTRIFLYPR